MIRSYIAIAGISTAFVLGPNLHGSLMNVSPIKIKDNPIIGTIALVTKSVAYGTLWPIIPFFIVRNPDSFFVLGLRTQEVIRDRISCITYREFHRAYHSAFEEHLYDLFGSTFDRLRTKGHIDRLERWANV